MNFSEIVNESFNETLSEGFINEAGERQFVSSENLFDVLSTMKGDVRMCVGYMTVAKLNLPQVQRINPATNRKKKYDDYETFGKEIGVEGNIVGIIKLSKYHRFNYVRPDDLKTRYSDYRDKKDAINIKYGLNATNKDSMSGKYSTKQEYGDNGIEAYNGSNTDKAGNTYMSQNVYNAQVSSVYCLIDDTGHIVKTLKKEDLVNYIKPYNNADVTALRKLGKEDSEIKNFLDEVDTLKMKYQKFESSKILYIAAKSNDYGKFTYINTNLPSVIGDVTINPKEFINIAAKQYKIDINNLD
jgi:hypothetical protein